MEKQTSSKSKTANFKVKVNKHLYFKEVDHNISKECVIDLISTIHVTPFLCFTKGSYGREWDNKG